MRYQVRFVPDDSLPDGTRWAFVRTSGQTYLFVAQSAIDETDGRCGAISDAWNAWQSCAGREGVVPRLVAI